MFVSRKEYKKALAKIDMLEVEIEDKTIIINKLKEELKELRVKTVEQEYRENVCAKEKLELNNIITNLLEIQNTLNAKLLKKNSRKRKEV